MSKKTWYFGPTSDLEMCNDDEYSSWVWIADNPDGWLDDVHITELIEAMLPPGFQEQCESIFNHTSDSYEEVRELLTAAGFVESRRTESSKATQCEDNEDEDGYDTCDECAAAPEVKLENAPETLEKAIERIMRLEMCLDDLARATEIAQFSKQYHLANTYVEEAEELLQTRIIVPEEEHRDMKITVVEGDIDDNVIKAVKE